MKTVFLSLIITLFSFKVIEAQNLHPIANEDYVEAYAQAPILIDVLANDYDPDGDSIYIKDFSACHGQVRIENDKVWYKPNHETGSHFIYYKVSDGLNYSNGIAYITVKINPHAPVAVQDTFHLIQVIPEDLELIANDIDVDGDNTKIYEITQVSGCSVTISPDSLSVTVLPDYVNICSFYYQTVENSPDSLLSRKARVIIYVADNPDRPIVNSDTATTTAGISVDIPVLENDYDPQNEELRFYGIYGPEMGDVEIVGNILRYHPDLSFTGEDGFYYRVCEVNDSLNYSESTKVLVNITRNPHSPVALPDTVSGMAGVPIIIDVMANDYDPDGDLCKPYSEYGTETADNKISFTSYSYEVGNKEITYKLHELNNIYSYSEDAKILIRLEPNPDFPYTVSDTVTTYAGVKVEFDVLENDKLKGYEVNGPLTLFIYPWEEKECLIEKHFGQFSYTPSYQSSGEHKFGYFVNLGDSDSIINIRGNVVVNVLRQNYTESIACNNINACVDANGDLFRFDYVIPGKPSEAKEDKSHFFVPKESKLSTISENQFFLFGLNNNNDLHSSRSIYDWQYSAYMFRNDWRQGPVSDFYDSSYFMRYSNVWKISKEEIEYHKQHFNEPDYNPIKSILTWPGNGLVQLGEAAQLAPFVDANGDAYYDPYQGDYPVIRGDECIFFMFNDDEIFESSTESPMKVEVHGMLYGFNNPDTSLFNSVFVHYDIINRSSNSYHDCYVGIMTDFDIGMSTDDFFRSDVTHGSFIGYNSLDVDGNGESGTYGRTPPAQSVTVLAGPYMDPDGIDNDDELCNESVNGLNFGNGVVDDERMGLSMASIFELYDKLNGEGLDSSYFLNPHEMYNIMQGNWDDDTPIHYGGSGHLIEGASQTRYLFPGNSDPLNYGTNCQFPANGYNQNGKYWTEDQVMNMGSDRKGLGSIGPFSLAHGQVQEIDLAYCTGFGDEGAESSLKQLFRNIDTIKNAVAQGKIIQPNNYLGVPDQQKPLTLKMFPNPVTDIIHVNLPEFNSSAEYSIFNLYGSKVAHGLITNQISTIKVGQLPSGVFIFKIIDGKNTVAAKFVKY